MAERLSSYRREEKTGISRSTMHLLGILLLALGMLSRGILQARVLRVGTGTTENLLEMLEISGGMAAAAVAIGLEALESCALPIFAVLTLEGFEKTGSFRAYFLRVLAVAAVSEIPFDLAMTGKIWNPGMQNPCFSLVLSLAMLYLYRNYSGLSVKNVFVNIVIALAALLWALLFRVQYGVTMLVVVAILWIFREKPVLRYLLASAAAISCCVGKPLYMFAPFGFLLVHYYHGEEGTSNRIMQYAIYPMLLVLVWAAGFLLFG